MDYINQFGAYTNYLSMGPVYLIIRDGIYRGAINMMLPILSYSVIIPAFSKTKLNS